MATTERVAPTSAAPTQPRAQGWVAAAGVAGAAILDVVVLVRSGLLPGLLFLVGTALGVVLFHSRFGFTSAWRQLLVVRQSAGLRAHLLMLAVACTLFAPLLAHQVSLHDVPVAGFVNPLGVALVVGAVLFGVGMQLGGSCASGTLFAVGSGQSAILLTLGGFVAGSTVGAMHRSWWASLPAHSAVSFTRFGGYVGAWSISMAIIGVVLALTLVAARGRSVPPLEPVATASGAARVVRGSWPLWVGAVLLGLLNALTLFLSGSPWGITYAFGLWGTKLLGAAGVHPDALAQYGSPVLADKTSVMDLGIVLGALVASALAGSWALHRRIPVRLAAGSVVGGLMMGYGAQLADGCNIGAYFSASPRSACRGGSGACSLFSAPRSASGCGRCSASPTHGRPTPSAEAPTTNALRPGGDVAQDRSHDAGGAGARPRGAATCP